MKVSGHAESPLHHANLFELCIPVKVTLSAPLFLLDLPQWVAKAPCPQLQSGCVGINNDLSLSQKEIH